MSEPQEYAAPSAPQHGPGAIGNIRPTGKAILLYIVTLGIYGLVWWFKTHSEMKDHTGQGLGGGIALLLAFFVGIVMLFLTPNEIGSLYKRRGQEAPVSAITGLWILLPIAGPFIWFMKTNGALNDYWRAQGATEG